MFQVGQQVVCIDDAFSKLVRAVYVQLPEEGKIYTVRAVYVGRGKIINRKPGSSDGEIGILLQELKNPPDPKHLGGNELGFNSERFRSLSELSEDEVMHYHDEATEPAELVPVHPGGVPEPSYNLSRT
ncbi:MAG: hypothetical protein ISQ14_00575 [Verrucomicrobiae bacterium]|nr:hypothetical protein [Verrucomicrobiae bacterium]